MAPLQVGDALPEGVKFEYVLAPQLSIKQRYTLFWLSSPRPRARLMHRAYRWAPITDSDPTACGLPQTYDASKEWKGKKVVLFSVPGSWHPTSPTLYICRADSRA